MRLSELSAASGVSIATIKYYLRERIVPQGELVTPTRAAYDERHLEALRLVRALVDAGLSIAQVRQVVEWMQEPVRSVADLVTLLGSIDALVAGSRSGETTLRPETARVVEGYGWDTQANPSAVLELQAAWDAAREAGFVLVPRTQERYASAMTELATAEIEHFPQGTLAEMVRYSVLGTVLMERVLLAMRKVAEATIAIRVLGGPEAVAQMRAEGAGETGPEGAQASETSSE